MTEPIFIGYDARGTDGTDMVQMQALYLYKGQTARIPANTPQAQVREAVLSGLGIDPAQADAQEAAAAQVRAAGVAALLAQVESVQSSAAIADTVADLRQEVMASLDVLSAALQLAENLAVAAGITAPDEAG